MELTTKIEKIAKNNETIGRLETILYCQKAYEMGVTDVYDLLIMLNMYREDKENE